ncbi:uncharacterized protein K452DRAFT_325055 [Aplosporella prunicola CBS 121167]|uniref:CRAL-TRIO domain-containing protein n=1 Tax=Aplosporella prunicola CBS 121167 TaxID=1176127 RepID=A0A6A6BLD0_9PEZI|nr:uncharacterized protein K452DRAFT_325055 [Aplosporella prunicola CBS 121167]KAF2144478.1 hypothetical protein K452DRAFT_325055 [Aplosporella prunicola CBS 121167]
MPADIPPGRPGNLTAEQEAKLRELWAALAKLMGVLDNEGGDNEADNDDGPADESGSTKDAKDGKKKKSRLHVFKRKHHDKDGKNSAGSSDVDSAASSTGGVDVSSLSLGDDDKHGQNKAFKAALADLSPAELRQAVWSMVKHDNPDGLLLRFLRARKWDVNAALIMLISTMHWRATEMHVDDDIMCVGELGAIEQARSADANTKKEGDDFLAQLRMGKSFLHGVDKEGRPMCFVRVRLHRQGEQSEPSLERFTVYTIETARMMLRPPVDTATIVFDMTGFSLANMDYTPVKFMIKCFEANYPESLGAVLVHKAPWVFQGIWSIIRGWLDPVVAGKVHFTKNTEELSSFVPLSQIPTELGGTEAWSYNYVEPAANENAALADSATRTAIEAERAALVEKYEAATLAWIQQAEAAPAPALKKERADLADALRENYWRLDPYVRARSLYDRTGVLGHKGKLEFYPKKVETSQDDLD